MSEIPVEWKTSLRGASKVNFLVRPAGIYAGSAGYVYRLNDQNGLHEAEKDISKYGYLSNDEVRLDATENGSFLAVGVYRHVVALEPGSFDFRWDRDLPGARAMVSVIVRPGIVYAAAGGWIHCWDFQGIEIKKVEQFGGSGTLETRLSMSEDGSLLVAGTDGHVAGMNPRTLDRIWGIRRIGDGFGPVNILCSGNDVFCASGYWVYHFDSKSGNVTNMQRLDTGRTNDGGEVTLFRTPGTSFLYAGSCGYGISLNTMNGLSKVFQKPLFTQGSYTLTSAAGYAANSVFAVCGRVYLLSKGGDLMREVSLAGYGNAETSLAIWNGNQIVVGPRGYVFKFKRVG